MKAIQDGDTVIEILSNGKVVAVLSPPHVASAPNRMVPPMKATFFQNISAQQHAAEQGVVPVTRVEDLFGPACEAEDWEGFDEALDRWRAEQTVLPHYLFLRPKRKPSSSPPTAPPRPQVQI